MMLSLVRIESLKIFCDVVRLRSFSQAAELNQISQPAVSQAVLQVEQRLGAEFIDRSTRPLHVTDVGKEYYRGCKKILEEYMELEGSIRNDWERMEVTVQLAAIYSAGMKEIDHCIERVVQQSPNARIEIEYLHPNHVYQKVLDGTADLGLVSFPKSSRILSTYPWKEEPMVLACTPEHRFAKRKSIPIHYLADERFVGFEKNLVIRRKIDRFLKEQRVTANVVLEFDNIENIKEAVEVGSGVALLPQPTLLRETTSKTLVTLSLARQKFVRPMGIIRRRQAHTSLIVRQFIDLLCKSKDILEESFSRDLPAKRISLQPAHQNDSSKAIISMKKTRGTS